MELTPQSRRSPTSPSRYMAEPQPLPHYEYPSPQSEPSHVSADCLQGLGITSGPLSASTVDGRPDVTRAQSPTATNIWPTLDVQHHDTTRPSQSTPNILSADYDPFAPFSSSPSAAYSHDIYSTHIADFAVLPSSVFPSGNSSQRSSFSSATPSGLLGPSDPSHNYSPRIKMEDHADFAHAEDSMILGSTTLSHNVFVPTTVSYPGSLEAALYREQSQLGWPKVEYVSKEELPSVSASPAPPYELCSEIQGSAGCYGQRKGSKGSSSIARTRQPRKLTTKEDANFQCDVPGCGKLFGRSYNFKAHMETHDTSREYPFPCSLPDCNKKFVRKTDLQRHHQSVHMKERNHRCDYCRRYFARRDTLRRHMDDGCSKRFDIETVDFGSQIYGEALSSEGLSHATETRRRPRISSTLYPSLSLPRGSARSREHDNTLMSSSEPCMGRQEFLNMETNEGSIWSD